MNDWLNTMKSCYIINKSNITNRILIIHNKTRYSAKYVTMECLSREYKHLTKEFSHKDSTLNFDRSKLLKSKVEKTLK